MKMMKAALAGFQRSWPKRGERQNEFDIKRVARTLIDQGQALLQVNDAGNRGSTDFDGNTGTFPRPL